MDADENFWGSLIRVLREEQNLSQRQLARLADVNRSTLRRLEAGPIRGDITVIERLLSALGYELDALARTDRPGRSGRQVLVAVDPERRSRRAAEALLRMNPPLPL